MVTATPTCNFLWRLVAGDVKDDGHKHLSFDVCR